MRASQLCDQCPIYTGYSRSSSSSVSTSLRPGPAPPPGTAVSASAPPPATRACFVPIAAERQVDRLTGHVWRLLRGDPSVLGVSPARRVLFDSLRNRNWPAAPTGWVGLGGSAAWRSARLSVSEDRRGWSVRRCQSRWAPLLLLFTLVKCRWE